MKQVKGRKDGKSIWTWEVPGQGLKSSTSIVKKKNCVENQIRFHSNLSFRGTGTCKEVSKNRGLFFDS